MTGRILRSVFDRNNGEILAKSLAHAADISGPLTAAIVSRKILKLIVGINLLFCELWELQHQEKSTGQQMLSRSQIEDVCERFMKSEERKRMVAVIEKGMHLGNCFSRMTAARVANEAMEAAQGKAIENFSRSERLRTKEWESFNAL